MNTYILSGCLIASAVISLPDLYACKCSHVSEMDSTSSLMIFEETIQDCETYEIYDETYLDALYGAMGIYAKTDLKKGVAAYKKAKLWDPNFPVLEDQEDGSYIISNIPAEHLDEAFIASFAKTMTKFGICESPDDVQLINQTVHIVPAHCKKKALMLKGNDVEWCKDNCDTIAYGLGWSCGMLRNNRCITACMMTVEVMRRSCRYCCDDNGFVQRCLWPLADYFPRCDCDDMDWGI